MSTDLKVLHITRKSSQLSYGTPFIFLQISNHIDFTPYQGCFINSEVSDPEIYRNPTIIFPNDDNEIRYFKCFKHIPRKTAERIKSFIEANRISIVHFHYGSDTVIYWNLIRVLEIPFMVSFYGYDVTSFPRWYMGLGGFLLRKVVFSNAFSILAMSPQMKEDLLKLGCAESKIVVHYFGNDLSLFLNKNRDYSANGKLKLLIMASLIAQKGHLFLLSSLLKLEGNIPYHLTIVGEGELEPVIRKFVEENNLSSVVTFKKNLPYGSREMLNEYRNADIYLQPSVTSSRNEKEGIPGAMIEAMAMGLPVISTYHSGIPHVIRNNENGLLVHEWDVDKLGSAIDKLLSDCTLRKRLGITAQAFVESELDCRKKAAELESIYHDAIRIQEIRARG